MDAEDVIKFNGKADRKSLMLQTQAGTRQPKASQLWQDFDTNKFYMINAANGSQKKVNAIGENVKKYY